MKRRALALPPRLRTDAVLWRRRRVAVGIHPPRPGPSRCCRRHRRGWDGRAARRVLRLSARQWLGTGPDRDHPVLLFRAHLGCSVAVVLWRGSEQCVVAQGLVLGGPYGERFNYVAGSTITQSGNSFTGSSQCRAGAVAGQRSFTTDRLQFVLRDMKQAGRRQGQDRLQSGPAHGLALRVAAPGSPGPVARGRCEARSAMRTAPRGENKQGRGPETGRGPKESSPSRYWTWRPPAT